MTTPKRHLRNSFQVIFQKKFRLRISGLTGLSMFAMHFCDSASPISIYGLNKHALELRLKSNKSLGVFSFFLAPLLSIAVAVKNYHTPWARNLVWAFIIFYAYHFITPNEGADIKEYINQFRYYIYQDFSLRSIVLTQYSEGSTRLDILEPLLSYLISRVTTNYKVLMLAYGVIFGFFYSRNIWFFLDELKGKIKPFSPILLSLLLVTIGLWYINSFRFWCAAHIYIFASFRCLILRKKTSLFILFLSPLMHIGLALPVILTLIFRFVKIPVRLTFPIFIISAFLPELNWDFIHNAAMHVSPALVYQRFSQYTSEAYVQSVNDRLQSYGLIYQLSRWLTLYFTILFTTILYVNRKLLKKELSYRIFQFYLFFGIFSNLISHMPSGDRYLSITTFLMAGTMLIFYQNLMDFRLKRWLVLSLPACFFLALYQFRIFGLQTFSIHHLINNPIVSLFIY